MNKGLLQRYVEGDIADEDVGKVVEWLNEDESHVSEYLALHKLHDITVVNTAGTDRPVGRRVKLRRIWRRVAGIAAVAVAVMAIERLVPVVISPAAAPAAMQTIEVPAGQRVKLMLPDGTQVWINAKSTLTYPVDFGKEGREVTLDGEAFFTVEADSGNPFRVNVPGANLVVTGTEFNVASYSGSDGVSVALLKGQVSVHPVAGDSNCYTMKPGELAVLSEGRINVSSIKYPNYFRWREGLICFNDETVGDIIKKLELYYDIKIDVQREGLLKRRYTGKFRTKDGIEQVLTMLQLEHKFNFEKDNEKNLITIK